MIYYNSSKVAIGKDSLPLSVYGATIFTDTSVNYHGAYAGRYDTLKENGIDTILVFILYSDKALANGTVHSMYAYEVVNSRTACCDIDWNDLKIQDHVKYLDHNKKEFPESIVVWLAKKEN
jgi:hypothetical protein